MKSGLMETNELALRLMELNAGTRECNDNNDVKLIDALGSAPTLDRETSIIKTEENRRSTTHL